jgi:hypothetical protein
MIAPPSWPGSGSGEGTQVSDDENLSELSEAARRAGYIVTEQIDAIMEKAEQQAEAIRRDALRDAEDTRRAAVEAAQRLLARLEALEFPLGSLVASLRDEAEHVSRQLDEGAPVDTMGTALPSGGEQPQEIIEEVEESPEAEHEDEVSENGRGDPRAGEQEEPAQSQRFEEPRPAAVEEEPGPARQQAPGDWKRWIIDDEDDLPDRTGQASKPTS